MDKIIEDKIIKIIEKSCIFFLSNNFFLFLMTSLHLIEINKVPNNEPKSEIIDKNI